MLKMLAVWIAWRPRRWRISGASAGSTGVASRTSAPARLDAHHRRLESRGDARRGRPWAAGCRCRRRPWTPGRAKVERGVELGADDVGEQPAAHGEVGVGEVVAGLVGQGRQVRGEPVGPADVLPLPPGALSDMPSVNESPIATYRLHVCPARAGGWPGQLVARAGHGRLQSTGAAPCAHEQLVGAAERPRAEEARAGGQGGGVRRSRCRGCRRGGAPGRGRHGPRGWRPGGRPARPGPRWPGRSRTPSPCRGGWQVRRGAP